jgi:hypothetical protein
MCGPPPDGPLCETCQEKVDNGAQDSDLCSSCQEMLKRYCWCCFTLYDTPEEADIIEGVCKKCRDKPGAGIVDKKQ